MDIFIQQLINGLVLGSMYALVALGYTMVYGIVNLINFAHGEVLMVGALVSWTVVTLLGDTGWPGWVLLTLSLLAGFFDRGRAFSSLNGFCCDRIDGERSGESHNRDRNESQY